MKENQAFSASTMKSISCTIVVSIKLACAGRWGSVQKGSESWEKECLSWISVNVYPRRLSGFPDSCHSISNWWWTWLEWHPRVCSIPEKELVMSLKCIRSVAWSWTLKHWYLVTPNPTSILWRLVHLHNSQTPTWHPKNVCRQFQTAYKIFPQSSINIH